MQILKSIIIKNKKTADLAWQGLYLIVSFAPALAVCQWTLTRPVLKMGSDQDFMWASEGLRLLRGLGPSYADHPGAIWPVLHALTIRVLDFFSTTPVLEGESISAEGLRSLIQVIRIENALIAGFVGILCCQVLINLKTSRYLALVVNLASSCSTPTLIAASAVRHELVSVVFMLMACLLFQILSRPETNKRRREAFGVGCIFLVFAAAFSKQQSLIVLPFIFWIGLTSAYFTNPTLLNTWLMQWKHLRVKPILLLLAIWSLSWAISAAPDIDFINLPAWIIINLMLSGIILLSTPLTQVTNTPIYKAAIIAAIIEILITRLISANWWRQAVTGFPSWLLMFANQSETARNQPALYTRTLHQYFELIFSLPDISIMAAALVISVSLFIVAKCWITPRYDRRSDFGSELFVAISWLLSFAVTAICLLRENPPYAIYFYPCIMISSALIFPSQSTSKIERFNAVSAIKILSIFLISTGTTRSISNIGHFEMIGLAGLPENAICMSHNMDPSMKLTAVGSCPDFKNESAKKAIFDSWWRGPL